MLRTAVLLAGSGGVIALMRFARNVLLARLLGVEDFGIASTFALLMAMVEMLSDLGIRTFVVQNREGDRPEFLAAVQGLALLRGACLSILIVALADPIAALLGQPELGWAYRILAIVPLLRAAVNLDGMRQQRALRFGLTVKAELSGMAASLAALAPLWLWLGDFRVMLGMLAVEAGVQIAAGHLLAERPYRLGWSGPVAVRALRFGWPLLLGGTLTFAVMQGERLIVANQYTASDLGLFSAALTLAMAPTLLVQRIVNSMFLPLLARQQDNDEHFLQKAELVLETLLAGGLGLMLLYVLAGPGALRLLYGAEFAAGAQLVAILGITFGLRTIRTAPTNVFLAKGRTLDLLIANGVRLFSFPAAYLIAIRGGSMEAMALTGIAGEAAALLSSYSFIAARAGFGPVMARRASVYLLAALLVLLLAAIAAGLVAGPVPVVCAGALYILVLALCRRFVRYFVDEILKVRAPRG
jgi:O-antigen/teichoic acid export membrane protein